MEEKVKRTWHYIMKPQDLFEVQCTKCKGINLEWSEWDDHIWCFDCEIDFNDYDHISGPIPVMAAYMLGMTFDKFDIVNQKLIKFNLQTNKYDSDEI